MYIYDVRCHVAVLKLPGVRMRVGHLWACTYNDDCILPRDAARVGVSPNPNLNLNPTSILDV